MNNLDPDVAEDPDNLVVYGGTGRAARSWPDYHAIVAALRRLADDETLLVQSGRPVGVFRTHAMAPRVLLANSLLVPDWADWATFRELEAAGLTMYGQMTAGSWIYIGTQGIVQGTYETFAAVAEQRFGGSLEGRLVLTAGCGGMGGAQPLAVAMLGGVCLIADVDHDRLRRRYETRYLDLVAPDLDSALREAEEARGAGRRALDRRRRRRRARSSRPSRARGVVARRGHRPDVGARPARRLRPDRPVARARRRAARARPRGLRRAPRAARWRATARRWSPFQDAGAVVFDYGNNLRTEARAGGFERAFDYPGFVPAYVRPLFCRGIGPFRWVALSGDPDDIAATDAAMRELFPDERAAAPLARPGRRSASPSRACRRASAGSATATATAPGCASTSSSAAARSRRRS